MQSPLPFFLFQVSEACWQPVNVRFETEPGSLLVRSASSLMSRQAFRTASCFWVPEASSLAVLLLALKVPWISPLPFSLSLRSAFDSQLRGGQPPALAVIAAFA